MAGYTYDTLIGDLVDWVEDDSPEFAAALDRIVAIASNKVARDLDIEVVDEVRHGQTVADSGTVAKPSDYQAIRTLEIQDDNGAYQYVEQRTYDYVMDYGRDPDARGVPRYFCEANETEWMVAPVPDKVLAYRARIIVTPEALTSYRPRTWVSEHAPEALLYAALLGCEEFLKADDRLPVWRERYDKEVIPSYRNQLRGMLRSDYSPQTTVQGGQQ